MLDDNLNHRAGAEVTAIEANAGTAELCEHIACLNQAAGSIQVIHKDARHLQLGTDLAQPHDILVFEVWSWMLRLATSAQCQLFIFQLFLHDMSPYEETDKGCSYAKNLTPHAHVHKQKQLP